MYLPRATKRQKRVDEVKPKAEALRHFKVENVKPFRVYMTHHLTNFIFDNLDIRNMTRIKHLRGSKIF